MTLAEKFAGLTPEQKEKFAGIKSPEELDAFLAESKIELTLEERKYLNTGVEALTDDELAEVAGGAMGSNYARSNVFDVIDDFKKIERLVSDNEHHLNSGEAETIRRVMRDLESEYNKILFSFYIDKQLLSSYNWAAQYIVNFLERALASYGISIGTTRSILE